jgi:hypothetical protein
VLPSAAANAGAYFYTEYYYVYSSQAGSTQSSTFFGQSVPFINITVSGAGLAMQPASTPTTLNIIPATGANTLLVSPSFKLTTALTVTIAESGTDCSGSLCGTFGAAGSTSASAVVSFAVGDGPQNPKSVTYNLGASTTLGTGIYFNYTTTLGSIFPSPRTGYPVDFAGKIVATTTQAIGTAVSTAFATTVSLSPALTGSATFEVYAYDSSYSGTFTNSQGSGSYCTLSATALSCVFTWTPYSSGSATASGTQIYFSFSSYTSWGSDFPATQVATLGPWYNGALPGTGGSGYTGSGHTGSSYTGGSTTGTTPTTSTATRAGSSSGGGGATGKATSSGLSGASSLSFNFVALLFAAVVGVMATIYA